MNNPPLFWIWFLKHRGVTIRCFGWLFQIKPIHAETFSQRNDRYRLREFGWSIKAFGQ